MLNLLSSRLTKVLQKAGQLGFPDDQSGNPGRTAARDGEHDAGEDHGSSGEDPERETLVQDEVSEEDGDERVDEGDSPDDRNRDFRYQPEEAGEGQGRAEDREIAEGRERGWRPPRGRALLEDPGPEEQEDRPHECLQPDV